MAAPETEAAAVEEMPVAMAAHTVVAKMAKTWLQRSCGNSGGRNRGSGGGR